MALQKYTLECADVTRWARHLDRSRNSRCPRGFGACSPPKRPSSSSCPSPAAVAYNLNRLFSVFNARFARYTARNARRCSQRSSTPRPACSIGSRGRRTRDCRQRRPLPTANSRSPAAAAYFRTKQRVKTVNFSHMLCKCLYTNLRLKLCFPAATS